MTGLIDFLIVGAMKSGTTSLFFDLKANPMIFFPEDKEPSNLLSDDVLSRSGRETYADLFRGAVGGQMRGEASTAYTKLPDFPGVARRARQIAGEELRIIYLVREPVARAVSQHRYEVVRGTISERDADVALRTVPRLANYSRYAMQLDPWLEAFGPERVRVVRFEDFIEKRKSEVARVSEFLGVSVAAEGLEAGRVYNRGEDAWVPRGPAWKLSRTRLYRRFLRPFLSRSVRGIARDLLTPRPPDRPDPPSADTIATFLEQLAEDMDRFHRIVGADQPWWDLEATKHH